MLGGGGSWVCKTRNVWATYRLAAVKVSSQPEVAALSVLRKGLVLLLQERRLGHLPQQPGGNHSQSTLQCTLSMAAPRGALTPHVHGIH